MNEEFQEMLIPLILLRQSLIIEISKILTTQTDILKKKSVVLVPLYSFSSEYTQLQELFAKLDDDFLAWESAIQQNKGQGVSAFLDAAEPITESMRKNLEAIVTLRKDQISRGAHRPPVGLVKPLEELIEASMKLDDAIKNPPPNEEEAKSVMEAIYYNMWTRISKMQKRATDILLNDKAFLERVSREKLGETIERYQSQAKLLFKTYNELIDAEDETELPSTTLAEAKQVKALREERQAQLVAAPGPHVTAVASGQRATPFAR